MQAGALVGADDDFTTGYTFGFRDCGADSFSAVESLFRITEKNLPGGGERNFAAGAIEQARANFLFKRTDLRRDRRLRTETLLGGSRERTEPRNFDEGFQLIEIHG